MTGFMCSYEYGYFNPFIFIIIIIDYNLLISLHKYNGIPSTKISMRSRYTQSISEKGINNLQGYK